MDSFLKKECDLNFFHENNYFRNKCTSCGSYFWTLKKNLKFCGDQPCVNINFINNTLGKKPLTLEEIRELFLSFFEKHNHSRLHYPDTDDRCTVIARWRSDIYLTIASIADFQPHVTSGEVPPPANPLVISQPCIRLNDLDEVGKSGRHLTMFEMMGHHAFNKNINEIYWKEKTVDLCNKFFVEEIGIKKEDINYKEQLWDGGGNAGPCLEVLAGGIEIATLVFMNMKEDENGRFTIKGKKYSENPLNIVDTGYGLERISWCTNGTENIYETVFPQIIKYLTNQTKSNLTDLTNIYTLSDHSKCIAFMLGDGIVPSNVKAGYLARLMIRRAIRVLEQIKLSISLTDLVNKQLDILKDEFPSLNKNRKQINEILEIETQRFSDTLYKGKSLVKRIIKEKERIDKKELITLYDTHGLHPDVVKKIAEKEGVKIIIPENFDSMIAELHSHEKINEVENIVDINLPNTEKLYINHYIKEFNADVIWTNKIGNSNEIILNRTAFYPEGGGQLGDIGTLSILDKTISVKNVKKVGNAIIHIIDGELEVGQKVHGKLNWDHRYILMKHHTGTHVVNGALRKLFGEHIWQAGSQLGINDARFDFSHYKSISEKERSEIEKLSNELIKKSLTVEKKLMKRNDAEREFGFRLYQGGVPSGNLLHVINIKGIDVEACGGTHINNTKEIEKIRILKTERIQDGVNRIIFAAGRMVDKYQKEEDELYINIKNLLLPYFEIKNEIDISQQLRDSSKIFSVTTDQLYKTIKRFLDESDIDKKIRVDNLIEASNHLFKKWKKHRKIKKKVASVEIEKLKNQAEIIPGTNVKIITNISKYESIITAVTLTKEPNYVVHIYDGNKITSAASKNVDIDLRDKIAPAIGKILGGSGGGKQKLTNSGGPNKERVVEALEKAKKMTIELLIKT
jgi:alanyl-tRNA synthetase